MKLTKLTRLTLIILLLCSSAKAQFLKKLESSDNLYKEARREIELKHYPKAVTLCNRALDISPRNLDLHLLLGRAFSLDGKIDSARIELNYVIQKNPRYRDAYIYLVNMEAVACNYDQAIEYCDMGLKYYPNDRDLLLKKLDVFNKQGNWIESNRLADYLFDRFSSDPYIRSVFLDYKLTLSRQYAHKGYIELAKRSYESVLEQDPLNKEAMQAVYNLDVKSGNYESSLAYTNRALLSNPNSYEFLMKKVGILEAMQRYAEATSVIEKLIKLYPTNADVRKLDTYMRMEGGRYYMNTDPYIQFQSVLEKDPGNKDALNYIINIAFSRGLLVDALQWTNMGLKSSPNDKNLLNKKMGILESLKRYGAASNIAEKTMMDNPTPANKQNFADLKMLAARDYINEQEYDSAEIALKAVLKHDPANIKATDYLISAYSQQKRYDDALRTIDDGLAHYPGDEHLLFKKAGILESYQHYADAALISKELLQRFPDSRQYLVSFVEQSLEAGRQSMQYDDYYSTATILREVLERQPNNIDALNYMINIQSSFKEYDSAIHYVNQALHYYPDSKDFMFKKSSVLSDAHLYKDAYAISGDLHNNYPYNMRFRNTYTDQLIASGKQYLTNNQPDSALGEFYKALEVSPTDSLALTYAINVLNDKKQYDTALALIAVGRQYYPNNPYFLLKRTVIYENMKRYDDAWLTADTLSRMTVLEPKYLDYVHYLYSKRLRNEVGISFLRSYFDSSLASSIATIQYSHRFKRLTVTARVNYAGRPIGTGFQLEGEAYYAHSPKWSSFAVAAYAPSKIVFPTLRLGYSLTHIFKHGWEGELGVRYLDSYNGIITSGVASVGKEIKDFYFNLRGYYIVLQHNDTTLEVSPTGVRSYFKDNATGTYYSGVLTTRYFINPLNRTDFLTVILGYGTAPDDFSRSYNITHLLSYNTVSVGAGWQRQIFYRTTFGIFGSWYNYEIEKGLYRNQYDIYLTLLRKF